jgi:DNA-directed RNA polymerase I subunit RPA49
MTLGQEFGTKKAKKVIADQTVNAIHQRRQGETAPPVDAAQQAMLDQLTINTEGMMSREEQQKEMDKSKPRPNPDMHAKSPADVYTVDNLVGEEELGLIKVNDWQSAMKKGENVKLGSRYVANRLRRTATVKDTTNLKLLKYMFTMLTWYGALEKQRDGKKLPNKDKLREKVDAPAAILESLRRKFTDSLYVHDDAHLSIISSD